MEQNTLYHLGCEKSCQLCVCVCVCVCVHEIVREWVCVCVRTDPHESGYVYDGQIEKQIQFFFWLSLGADLEAALLYLKGRSGLTDVRFLAQAGCQSWVSLRALEVLQGWPVFCGGDVGEKASTGALTLRSTD